MVLHCHVPRLHAVLTSLAALGCFGVHLSTVVFPSMHPHCAEVHTGICCHLSEHPATAPVHTLSGNLRQYTVTTLSGHHVDAVPHAFCLTNLAPLCLLVLNLVDTCSAHCLSPLPPFVRIWAPLGALSPALLKSLQWSKYLCVFQYPCSYEHVPCSRPHAPSPPLPLSFPGSTCPLLMSPTPS